MRSPRDDRTARARIRDEALRLFGDRGPDGVTIRDVAAAAGVSPALVMRHYGTKDGLRDAVQDHVARVFEPMLDQVVRPAEAEALDQGAVPALAGMAAAGSASAGEDPAVRAAFLLVNDVAVLILRDRIREVLGTDPLSAAGMRRWGGEVLAVYRDGIGAGH